jgi:predicted Zn-dependent peptidase
MDYAGKGTEVMRRLSRILPLFFILIALGAWAAEPSKTTLPNGLRLITLPGTSSHLVSVELLIDFSATDEPMQAQGLRQVLLMSMLCGSETMDGVRIRHTIAAAGGILAGRVQQDALEFSATVPADALPVALSALARIVEHPRLSDADVQSSIVEAQQTILASPNGIVDMAGRYARALLYADHPYASRGLGQIDTLGYLTPDIIRYVYHAFVMPNMAVMSIVGHGADADVRAQVANAFGDWPRGDAPGLRSTAKPPVLDKSQTLLREAPVQNTCVLLMFSVCGVHNKDFLTLRVIDALLSGGTGARLMRNVREQKHLAYQMASEIPNQMNCSDFTLYALTNSRALEDTRQALADELMKLQVTPVASPELERARAYLKGRYLLSHQSGAQYAYDLAWDELAGLGIGYDTSFATQVDAVTAGDVQRVARAYFTHFCVVVIEPLTVDPSSK